MVKARVKREKMIKIPFEDLYKQFEQYVKEVGDKYYQDLETLSAREWQNRAMECEHLKYQLQKFKRFDCPICVVPAKATIEQLITRLELIKTIWQ